MINQEELEKIKSILQEFLDKMTIKILNIELNTSFVEKKSKSLEANQPIIDFQLQNSEIIDLIILDIKVEEPQILIGQEGQTLFELERILKIILNKKLQESFYLKLDINDYKKRKIEYLKKIANELADQVFLTKEKKALPPMPAYERRIIHMELAQRQDVVTGSQGEGINRSVVISSR